MLSGPPGVKLWRLFLLEDESKKRGGSPSGRPPQLRWLLIEQLCVPVRRVHWTQKWLPECVARLNRRHLAQLVPLWLHRHLPYPPPQLPLLPPQLPLLPRLILRQLFRPAPGMSRKILMPRFKVERLLSPHRLMQMSRSFRRKKFLVQPLNQQRRWLAVEWIK